MSTDGDFINELKDFGASAKQTISDAKERFNESVTEVGRGSTEIVKRWANSIKNDQAKLAIAYESAVKDGADKAYIEQILDGKLHRLCFRTFVVNQYIYKQLKLAESDSTAVDDLLSEIEKGDSE